MWQSENFKKCMEKYFSPAGWPKSVWIFWGRPTDYRIGQHIFSGPEVFGNRLTSLVFIIVGVKMINTSIFLLVSLNAALTAHWRFTMHYKCGNLRFSYLIGRFQLTEAKSQTGTWPSPAKLAVNSLNISTDPLGPGSDWCYVTGPKRSASVIGRRERAVSHYWSAPLDTTNALQDHIAEH